MKNRLDDFIGKVVYYVPIDRSRWRDVLIDEIVDYTQWGGDFFETECEADLFFKLHSKRFSYSDILNIFKNDFNKNQIKDKVKLWVR